MSEPLRTSKEDDHFHYYRVDEDGKGRTSMYVDKSTKTKHFHRITKFQVEDAGLEEHSHELRGGRLSNVAKTNKDDGSEMTDMSRPSSQDDRELERREIEQLGRGRRGVIGRRRQTMSQLQKGIRESNR